MKMSVRSTFSLIATLLVALLSGVFWVMTLVVQNQQELAASETRHYQSYKLADELRQSSDDLTRMARTYVVTGAARYEEYFRRILAIRNGEAPRPENYGGIYWDLVTASGEAPAAGGETVALETLMRRMGFTDAEFATLREAQANSDALVALENRAMSAIKGLYADDQDRYTVRGEPDPELARQLMHGEAYHRAKARIMAPIDSFLRMVEGRTTRETAVLRAQSQRLASAALILMGFAVALVVLAAVVLQRRVARPLVELADAARRVEGGDYSGRIPVRRRDEVGRLASAFSLMSAAIERDIEERERTAGELATAREAAESANRAKSSFLANMSHELRTPMNAIIGYSEMLAEDMEDAGHDAYVPDLHKIRTAGKHLLALINDILDLSKIEAGRMDLYLEHFDLREMLDEAVATVAPLVHTNGNKLETDFGDELGTVRADLTKIRQSLFNLVSNAAKFTKNGTVTVGAVREREDEGDRIVLTVRDSGIGIPPEKLEHIFEEFSQADETTTRDFGGTGLGLSISRRFCRLMGGEITVHSRPGEGATFRIELPATVDVLEAAKSAAETPGQTVENREGERHVPQITNRPVLVIDDEADARDLLRRTLEGDGFEVTTAESGEVGLQLARELSPAVITLDIMMPVMDGWEVLRQLKADPELQRIPVVMMSILHEKGMGFALGATEYLTKPVDRKLLLHFVGQYSARTSERRVLVVEDDAPARELLRRTLEQEGWQVFEAENGKQALERASVEMPGLVVLDLMMPVMDGFQFLREFRKTAAGRTVPVLVLTAKELDREEQRFLGEQAAAVVQKNAGDLNAAIEEMRSLVATRASPKS
jgi:signal transduction histidine kinase/DNA-binding response OmpR family regulator